MSNVRHSCLALGFYFLLGIIIFHPALKLGFLGDDAVVIWGSQSNWFDFPGYQSQFLVPLIMLLGGFYKLFQLNPWPYHAFHLSLNSHLEASRIYEAGLKAIRDRLPQPVAGANLVLVDFPDYIYNRQGPAPTPHYLYYIYVFRNGLPAHLLLLNKGAALSITHYRLSPPSPANPNPMGLYAPPEEMVRLAGTPHASVLRYLPGPPPRFVAWGEAR